MPAMTALTSMTAQLETDLANLIRYLGEDPAKLDSEAMFQLVVTFGDALQDAAHDIKRSQADANGKTSRSERPSTVGSLSHVINKCGLTCFKTHRSIGRGGFDEALRDLHAGTGLRRQRQEASAMRPSSRIFLDGSRH